MSGKRRNTSRLLLDEQPLQVLPTLACKLGLNRAMFLQQLHYWLQKPSAHERDGKCWIYNTFEEWHEQFPFWSPEAIRKIAAQLEEKGLIETTSQYNGRKSDRTKWYTINYEYLNSLLDPTPPEGPDKSTEGDNPPDKSTEGPEKSTEHEPDKSWERYQRESTNRDSPEGAAEAATGVEEQKPKNYMDVFTEAAKLFDYDVTTEDRKELPKNLKLLARSEDDATMRQVVWRCLDARANRNYSLSPQRAHKELSGNVASIGGKQPPEHERVTFDSDGTPRYEGKKITFTDDGWERELWIGNTSDPGRLSEVLAAFREHGVEPEYQKVGDYWQMSEAEREEVRRGGSITAEELLRGSR